MPKICPYCGSTIVENMRFCVNCGKPLGQTEYESQRYPAESMENMNNPGMNPASFTQYPSSMSGGKPKRGFPVWIIPLILILAGGAAAAYFFLFSNTVKLNKYIDIYFDGTDGEGVAWVEFDNKAFISDYGTRIEYKSGLQWLDQMAALFSTPAELLQDSCIKGVLDNTSGLSNGDEVVFKWDCDDVTARRYFNVKLKYSDIKKKVEGLSEPKPGESQTNSGISQAGNGNGSGSSNSTSAAGKGNSSNASGNGTSTSGKGNSSNASGNGTSASGNGNGTNASGNGTSATGNGNGTNASGNGSTGLQVLDPFANIEIQYDGVSPYLEVSVNDGHAEQAVQQHVTFSVKDGAEHVSCGQSFTLTAEFQPDLLADEGFRIAASEKQYTVPDDLPRFLTEEEEVDLTRVRKDLHDYLEAHASGAVGQEAFWVQNGMDFVNFGSVGKEGLYNPEITKINSVTEIKRYWMNRKTQYDDKDSIHNRYAVLYKIEISARGYKTNNDFVDYKRTAYSLVSAENIYTTEDGVSWTGKNGLGGEEIVCHSQMDEKDQLLSNWMTSYKDEYNVKESEPKKKGNNSSKER